MRFTESESLLGVWIGAFSQLFPQNSPKSQCIKDRFVGHCQQVARRGWGGMGCARGAFWKCFPLHSPTSLPGLSFSFCHFRAPVFFTFLFTLLSNPSSFYFFPVLFLLPPVLSFPPNSPLSYLLSPSLFSLAPCLSSIASSSFLNLLTPARSHSLLAPCCSPKPPRRSGSRARSGARC